MFEPTGVTRQAVEFLTLWLEPGVEARQSAAAHITRVTGQDPTGEWARTVAGLLNLSMFLVLMLAEARGARTDDEVSDEAQVVLSELSLRLPE